MNIIIRVDGSDEIGTGHVMRMLAIAEGLIDQGHELIFCSCLLLETLSERILKIGASVIELKCQISSNEDLSRTLKTADENKIDAIILDGYDFGVGYLSTLREKYKLIFIDDQLRLETMEADIVINSSPFASREMYAPKISRTELLLGPEYAMLRKEFRVYSEQMRPIEQRNNILISFGGTDVLKLTVPVVNKLVELFAGDQIFDVVVQKGFNETFPKNVKIHENCSYMAKLMASAGLSISAGGSTLGELALMQVPTILVVAADNQEKHAEWANQNNINYVIDARLKDSNDIADEIGLAARDLWRDIAQRKNLNSENRKLVDGNGVDRIIGKITAIGKNIYDA